MNLQLRDLRVQAADYEPRTEFFHGEEHLVVPVVALVEGVVHAMNAAMPEFASAREFLKQTAGWNGRPIFEGHPIQNGRPCSGNLPEVLAAKQIGTVFNAGAVNEKLAMEAWINVRRCQRIAPAMLARAKAGEPIEISIGTFVDTDDVVGEHNGRTYRGAWKDLTPDHLALLPVGIPGACSRTMGCGVRYAQDAHRALIGNGNNQYSQHQAAADAHRQAGDAHAKAQEEHASVVGSLHESRDRAYEASATAMSHSDRAEEATIATESGYKDAAASKASDHAYQAANRAHDRADHEPGGDTAREHSFAAQHHYDAERAHRKAMKNMRAASTEPDYAGPNNSFPIAAPADVANAAQALGRAKGDRAAIKRRIVAIAYQRGEEFVSRLPDDWKRKVDASRNASAFARLMEAARAMFRPAQDADEMSDGDLKRRLLEALKEVEPNVSYVESYHPVTDPTHVVYCVTEPCDMTDPYATAMPIEQDWYERAFELSDAGTITLGTARVEVEPVMRYEPVEGGICEAGLFPRHLRGDEFLVDREFADPRKNAEQILR